MRIIPILHWPLNPYDNLNRKIRETDPRVQVTEYSYDAVGNKTLEQ